MPKPTAAASGSQAPMIDVVSVKLVGGYRLRVGFSDGSAGIHDFASTAARDGEMVRPLKDPAGRPTKVQGAVTLAAFQLESMDLASSKGSRWADPELRPWEGDSGTLHAFTWAG